VLHIEPPLSQRVGLFDTAAMPFLVEAGRRATEAALPAILALLQRAPQLAVA
jgi:NTE family protein